MKRKTLVFLIFVDLGFLAGVGYMLFNRYRSLEDESSRSVPGPSAIETPVMPTPVVSAPVMSTPPVVSVQPPSTSTAVSPEKPAETVPKVKPPKQKTEAKSSRTFVFCNDLSARSVQLVGDFNGWKPQPFHKTGSGRWTVSVALPRGDFSYNYIVDGQTIRDPNQRRTDLKGRSLLTVAF